MHLPQPTFSTLDSISAQALEKFDAIVIPAFAGEKSPSLGSLSFAENDPVMLALAKCKKSFDEILGDWPDFAAKAGEILEIPLPHIGKLTRLYVLGFGAGTPKDARKAGAAIGRKVKGSGYSLFSAYSSEFDQVLSHVIALSLSQYGWNVKTDSSKADKSARAKGSTNFVFVEHNKEAIKRAVILADATWVTRDLIHTPSNIKNPAWLAEQARELVRKSDSVDLTVTVKRGRELEKFGGLRAVGGSSPSSLPRLIEITYAPNGSKNWPHVVLVGKGITYDSGGLSLKRPYELMVPMKSDMAGAAAILSATVAASKIKPKVRITALMMCAENMVSATAQRPSDVIKQYGGTTVEIINTDAEGRLVLADGLAYADLNLNPDYLIDIATLTGAATLSLGRTHAATYSRNADLISDLQKVGERVGESLWPMPLVNDYKPALASQVADLNHDASAKKFGAGSVTAALFLEHFVGKQNWVHLDIAGTGRSDVDAGEFVKGGTGFGTRLLIEWIATLS